MAEEAEEEEDGLVQGLYSQGGNAAEMTVDIPHHQNESLSYCRSVNISRFSNLLFLPEFEQLGADCRQRRRGIGCLGQSVAVGRSTALLGNLRRRHWATTATGRPRASASVRPRSPETSFRRLLLMHILPFLLHKIMLVEFEKQSVTRDCLNDSTLGPRSVGRSVGRSLEADLKSPL